MMMGMLIVKRTLFFLIFGLSQPQFCSHFGIALGSFGNNFSKVLRPYCNCFGICFECLWDRWETISHISSACDSKVSMAMPHGPMPHSPFQVSNRSYPTCKPQSHEERCEHSMSCNPRYTSASHNNSNLLQIPIVVSWEVFSISPHTSPTECSQPVKGLQNTDQNNKRA